ncbi:MAG: sialate O-acetylesterase, partial [Planctomycetota bacterium]
GHSGGGFWSGSMTLLHPERVAAAFLRSGSPPLDADPNDPDYIPYELNEAVSSVPIMINLGTEEGYSVKEGRFAKVWPRSEALLEALRKQGGLAGISVDPLTGHQCGNQRYFAIAWLDECLTHRLSDQGLSPMPSETAWQGDFATQTIKPMSQSDDATQWGWLPSERIAKAWLAYVRDTKIPDTTEPPAPSNVVLHDGHITWDAQADFESGIRQFQIFRDGDMVASVPEEPKNPFGRPLFQGLLYSDTPTRPLEAMRWSIDKGSRQDAVYQVVTVNTVGLTSEPTNAVASKDSIPSPSTGPAHLFILSGQSNMGGLKPEESFIPTVEAEFGAENVIVHKLAVGGQPIRRWDKDWTVEKGDNPKQIGDLYEKLISEVKRAVGERPLKSITFAWMQGERDARESHGDIYAASFNRVLDQLRADLKRDDINFVIGRLSDYDIEQKRYPHWNKMRKVLVALASSSPRGAWVDTDDLNDGLNRRGQPIEDDLHYSAAGYVTFGKRLADSSIELVRQQSEDK